MIAALVNFYANNDLIHNFESMDRGVSSWSQLMSENNSGDFEMGAALLAAGAGLIMTRRHRG